MVWGSFVKRLQTNIEFTNKVTLGFFFCACWRINSYVSTIIDPAIQHEEDPQYASRYGRWEWSLWSSVKSGVESISRQKKSSSTLWDGRDLECIAGPLVCRSLQCVLPFLFFFLSTSPTAVYPIISTGNVAKKRKSALQPQDGPYRMSALETPRYPSLSPWRGGEGFCTPQYGSLHSS